MRLLHTSSLTVGEFYDGDTPKYAILSHVWQSGEVTFQDLQSSAASTKAGFTKIRNACSVAKECGYGYIWIDTCCI